jgi:hypothetical protein
VIWSLVLFIESYLEILASSAGESGADGRLMT